MALAQTALQLTRKRYEVVLEQTLGQEQAVQMVLRLTPTTKPLVPCRRGKVKEEVKDTSACVGEVGRSGGKTSLCRKIHTLRPLVLLDSRSM
jgi:hypothetical protein